MQNNKQKQEEMTQEESTATFTNYFGAASFKEDAPRPLSASPA